MNEEWNDKTVRSAGFRWNSTNVQRYLGRGIVLKTYFKNIFVRYEK